MSRDRTGILIIRAWLEQGSTAPLRAHIRQTTDIATGLRDGDTETDEDAITAVVLAWLQQVVLDGEASAGLEPTS